MSGGVNKDYPVALTEILNGAPCNELGPGKPNSSLLSKLESLSDEELFGVGTPANVEMALACRSGLLLRFDFLDESHRISQGIPSATGSFWHGIMHRREPDYSNGKYWFRKVGNHPVFPDLCKAAKEEVALVGDVPEKAKFLDRQSTWDSFAFVDICEEAASGQVDVYQLLQQIQVCEWENLFDWCWKQAAGKE